MSNHGCLYYWGVKVSFAFRDIHLVDDAEMAKIKELVVEEQRQNPRGVVETIEFLTDYLGDGMRYRTTTRVHVDGPDPKAVDVAVAKDNA